MTTVHDLENHSMDSWQETLTASSNVAIVSWPTDEAKAVEIYPFLADCPEQFMGGGLNLAASKHYDVPCMSPPPYKFTFCKGRNTSY